MSLALLKSLVALVPTALLFCGSLVLFLRLKAIGVFLQVAGAAGLVLVALAHVCEALQLFPVMHWGLEHSAGHYLDLAGAALGLTLFPLGYLIHALKRPPA